jgi:methionyl-tRNA formyltransferase
LHGGHPEEYRGLDSHLWAIYHEDFNNLVTTLHHVDPELDAGDVVLQEQLALTPGMELWQLRAVNTRACVRLCALALASLTQFDWLPARKQVTAGRYYSFMPAEFKAICIKKFAKYTAALPLRREQPQREPVR